MYHFLNQTIPHNEYQHCGYSELSSNGPPPDILRNSTELAPARDILKLLPPEAPIQAEANKEIIKTNGTALKKKGSRRTVVDTSTFSIEERLVAAVWVHERRQNKTSMSQIKHDFKQRFGRTAPAKNTLLVWERKLFSTGSVHDAPRSGRPVHRVGRAAEVAASLRSAPALSLRARAAALRVPRTTLRALLAAAAADLPRAAPPTHSLSSPTTGKLKNLSRKSSPSAMSAPSAANVPLECA